MKNGAPSEVDPSRSEFALWARGVNFSFTGQKILTDLNLEVRPATSVAIMGASGVGKSTLLQILAGLLTPDSGTVGLASAESLSADDVRLRNVGLVFQFGELLPELTLRENVELPLLFAGCRRREARSRAQSILDSVGLSSLGDRRTDAVSGGQQQRAAIARALIHRPAVVLADEPTGALDAETGETVLALMFDVVKAQRASLVVVTHSEAVARRCDMIYALCEGQLTPVGHQ